MGQDNTGAAATPADQAALDQHHTIIADHEALRAALARATERRKRSLDPTVAGVVADLRRENEVIRGSKWLDPEETQNMADVHALRATHAANERVVSKLTGIAEEQEAHEAMRAFEEKHALLLGIRSPTAPANGNGTNGTAPAPEPRPVGEAAPYTDRKLASAGEREERDDDLAGAPLPICVACGFHVIDHGRDSGCRGFVTPEGRPAIAPEAEKRLRELGFVPCVPVDGDAGGPEKDIDEVNPEDALEIAEDWARADNDGERSQIASALRALGWQAPAAKPIGLPAPKKPRGKKGQGDLPAVGDGAPAAPPRHVYAFCGPCAEGFSGDLEPVCPACGARVALYDHPQLGRSYEMVPAEDLGQRGKRKGRLTKEAAARRKEAAEART
ncbi:MAG: hypothetical protein QME96_04520 [Myxococcota bacterium]|nr:hypothetical protein [Myxococcota bacterium]